MFFIWNGLGFLVVVIVFAMSLLFNLGFNRWKGEDYYADHKWPFAVSLFFSAAICWAIGFILKQRADRVLVDPQTGEQVVIQRSNHSLFFIPMHVWGPVLAIIGIIVLMVDLLK